MSVISGPRPGLQTRRLGRDWGHAATLAITVAAVTACVGALLSFVVAPLTGTFAGAFEDFTAYAQAAHAMAAGTSPYAGFSSTTIVMAGFDYPPFAAMLIRPLDALSAHWQQVTWLALSLAALLAGAVITARTLLPARWPRARIGVLVALTFAPATYNLWHGQMNQFIFLLLALALSSYLSGHRTRCGVILGIAASIKLAPIVLLVVLARRGWWRAVTAGVATVAGAAALSVVAVGWPIAHQYLGSILPVLDRDNGWIYNQTWNGVVNRLGNHAVLAPASPSAAVEGVALLLSLGTLAALWLAVSPQRRTTAERGAEFACGIVAMLLVGSVAWYPVYVHLLIALAAAAGLAWERGLLRGALSAWAVACLGGLTAVGVVLISAVTISGIAAGGSGVLWWTYLQACSLPVILAVGLMAVLVRALRAVAVNRVASPAP